MKPLVTAAHPRGSHRWCKCLYCKGNRATRKLANRAARTKLKQQLKKVLSNEQL